MAAAARTSPALKEEGKKAFCVELYIIIIIIITGAHKLQ